MKYFILLSILHLFLNLPSIILIDQTTIYNYDNNYFKLKSNRKIYNIFFFGEREEGPLNITKKYPTLNTSWVYFYPQKSYTTFSFIKNGSYEIMIIRYGCTNYGKSYHGKIRIVSTEFPFSLSLNDDISFYSMKIKNDAEPCPIIVNLENNFK